jgi:ABC-type sugar transport system permease subunit
VSEAARGKNWSGLFFVLPFLLTYLAILIYPLLIGIALSFQRVDLFSDGIFVGFDNYIRAGIDGRAAADGDRARPSVGAEPRDARSGRVPRHLFLVLRSVRDDRDVDLALHAGA